MKAVIYARVSSKDQEETGYSLPSQEKLLQDYAQRKDLEVVKTFSVAESASGRKEREVFKQMIEYLAKHQIKNLLCEKVDRLTRNLKEAVVANDWVEEDVERRIHFVKNNLIIHKEAKSDEKFRWDIEIVLAKKYISNLSEEVKKGQAEKIRQGWLPTKPPLGYKTVGEQGHKIHVIDENIAPLIRQMFDLYATGNYSTRALAKEMYSRGLRNRANKMVGKSRLYDLLADPFFCGKMRWKGEVYPASHDALISEGLFNMVQVKLNRKVVSPYYSKHLPVFKGKIACGACHRTITWEKQKGKWYGGCKACKAPQGKTKYIRQELVEEQLLAKIVAVAPTNERVLAVLEKALKESHGHEKAAHEQKVRALRQTADRAQQRIEVMYEDRLDKRISPSEFDTRFKIYSAEKEDALKELKKLEEDNTRYYEAGFAIHELATRAKEIYLSPKAQTEDRRLLLSYAFSGLVLKQGKLEVTYTPAFEFLAKWMPKLNKDFELQKSVVQKGQKAASAASRPTLLRGQDSNLQPID